jgi:hypothetical protein
LSPRGGRPCRTLANSRRRAVGLSSFADAQIEAYAPLAIAATWIAALAGDGERAAHFAEAARRGSWDGPMPDGATSLESALALTASAFGLGGVSGMQRVLELEPSKSWRRTLALELLGISLALQEDYPGARAALTEVVRLGGGRSSSALLSLARPGAGQPARGRRGSCLP